MGKWVKGDASHHTVFDGKEYLFPSEKELALFLANPGKFAPALGGDCIVCFANTGKRMPGSIQFAVQHAGRVYLFPSEQEKRTFTTNPQKYENLDLAFDGKCAVCAKMTGKAVPGKPEFTAVYQGFRFQFPSDRERQTFVASPEKFVQLHAGTGRPILATTARDTASKSSETVLISGRSACAGCEFGVTPIGDPDSLGLAVKAPDGTVYVVESAERLYPEIYEKRFSGLDLKVAGAVIKKDGKFVWLQPTKVLAAN
jgi:YHS domain-containing protein